MTEMPSNNNGILIIKGEEDNTTQLILIAMGTIIEITMGIMELEWSKYNDYFTIYLYQIHFESIILAYWFKSYNIK